MAPTMVHTLMVALAVALLACAVHGDGSLDQCGAVYDGLAFGQFDMREQTSRTTLAANWFGFSDEVLLFEYAVVTGEMMPWLRAKSNNCFSFAANPDVVSWTKARQANSATINRMQLEVGETYHFLVRATFRSGRQGVVASDGVVVKPIEEIPSSKSTRDASEVRVERATSSQHGSGECPIDTENRCNAARASVGEYLLETYGPPVFNPVSDLDRVILTGTAAARARAGIYDDNAATRGLQRDFEGIGLVVDTEEFGEEFQDSSGDDDDSGGLGPGEAPAWVLAPILVALLLLVVLLAVIVVAVRVALRGEGGYESGGQSSSYGSALVTDDDDSKDYSQRKGANVGSADDRTAVNFPDTQIRRLSITHDAGDGDTDLLDEATKSPRRKHPIMSTQSSSTRNYQDDA